MRYKEIYKRELIGKNLGQFHSDFQKISESVEEHPHSIHAIYCGKKFYYHRLKDNMDNEKDYFRAKGIKSQSIEENAAKYFGGSVKKCYENILHNTLTIDEIKE